MLLGGDYGRVHKGSLGGLPGASSWKQGGSRTGLWRTICKSTCGLQMLGGVVMAILCYAFLFDFMARMGMVIGVVMFCVGAIGMLGAFNNNKDLLNFHIVGAILAILLSFQFVGQVWREVEVDCALAELYIKGNLLEGVTADLARHEMFNTVYQRINEVEDMLGMVHDGVVKTFQMFDYDPDHPDVIQESKFIEQKLASLKKHAASVITDVTSNPNITQATVDKWSETDRKQLEDKLVKAQEALTKIEKHESRGADEKGMTASEYEEILYAVTQAYLTPSDPRNPEANKDTAALAQDHSDLESTKSYLGRLEASLSTLEDFNKANLNLSKEMKEKRNHYNQEYMTALKTSGDKLSKFNANSLESMPQHCVTEEAGLSYMGFAGILVAIAELVSVYFTLCLLFRLPVKME